MDWRTLLLFGVVICWYEAQKTIAAFNSVKGAELKHIVVDFFVRKK